MEDRMIMVYDGQTAPFPEEISYAMAYVPYQPFEVYSDFAYGFEKGTIFPNLYMPWEVNNN